jgi:hypothetical protein
MKIQKLIVFPKCSLSRNVKSQNYIYWCSKNHRAVHKVTLHDLKVTMWCAMIAHIVTGPLFFEETDSDFYVKFILAPLCRKWTEEEKT